MVGRITALPKEGNTHPIPDDYYIKSICPSGGRMAAGIVSRYKTGLRLDTYR